LRLTNFEKFCGRKYLRIRIKIAKMDLAKILSANNFFSY